MYVLIYFLSSLSLIIIFLFCGVFFGAPWAPTRKRDFDRIAELAKLQSGMLFYDLGSGTGELLFYLSKKYNVNCVGIEISPFLFLYSKIKSLFYNKVKIHYGNLYKHDLSKADIIYIFLLPKNYRKLRKKLEMETRKGTKIILSCWPFKDYKPTKTDEEKNAISYYLYVTKTKTPRFEAPRG